MCPHVAVFTQLIELAEENVLKITDLNSPDEEAGESLGDLLENRVDGPTHCSVMTRVHLSEKNLCDPTTMMMMKGQGKEDQTD